MQQPTLEEMQQLCSDILGTKPEDQEKEMIEAFGEELTNALIGDMIHHASDVFAQILLSPMDEWEVGAAALMFVGFHVGWQLGKVYGECPTPKS